MARHVFFSFHYEKDINRANIVRNSWVVPGVKEANFFDHAEFEKLKKIGETAVKNWIDKQLKGSSVTVVLIGEETLERKYVQYEIMQSYERNNGIIGVHINRLKDMRTQQYCNRGNTRALIGYKNGRYLYFDEIADGIYDYTSSLNSYNDLGRWIELSARKHNKL
jgi:hypothetical protein